MSESTRPETQDDLLGALVGAVRPLIDPDVCSAFHSAWEMDHGVDGVELHDRIKELVAQYDADRATPSFAELFRATHVLLVRRFKGRTRHARRAPRVERRARRSRRHR